MVQWRKEDFCLSGWLNFEIQFSDGLEWSFLCFRRFVEQKEGGNNREFLRKFAGILGSLFSGFVFRRMGKIGCVIGRLFH